MGSHSFLEEAAVALKGLGDQVRSLRIDCRSPLALRSLRPLAGDVPGVFVGASGHFSAKRDLPKYREPRDAEFLRRLCGGGWGTWIRTKTNRVRADCSTVKLSPKRMPTLARIDLAARGYLCKAPLRGLTPVYGSTNIAAAGTSEKSGKSYCRPGFLQAKAQNRRPGQESLCRLTIAQRR